MGADLNQLLPSREPGRRTRLLGILNLTPDSFHDGGIDATVEESVRRARRMVEAGADAIDLGAESSRPGADPVPVEEELRRILPVLERLRDLGVPLSVDTVKAEVARRALSAGAHWINDISGLTADPAMAGVCAAAGCPVILMHMRGSPRTMQKHADYDDVVEDVRAELAARADDAVRAGIRADRIVLDPGIGFAKTPEQSFRLLRDLDRIRSLGFPVLVGASRKSFLRKASGDETADRLPGTLAVSCWAVRSGAEILRVHDVAENLAAVRTTEALLGESAMRSTVEERC
ncbi:MAG: dihydropteroate synthase [Gemmatimonadetes bacterium]|nr:dihydropteroate synthase [Gemmatimonadota bacterium]